MFARTNKCRFKLQKERSLTTALLRPGINLGMLLELKAYAGSKCSKINMQTVLLKRGKKACLIEERSLVPAFLEQAIKYNTAAKSKERISMTFYKWLIFALIDFRRVD